jgi:hypothetical protein
VIDLDLAADCVRELVRRAMEMPANSVRAADQLVPAGGQIDEFAEVRLLTVEDVGTGGAKSIATTGDVPDDTSEERVDQVKRIMASVNFYRAPAADAAGLVVYNSRAFARAASLEQRLQLNDSVALMNQMGLLLERAGRPRNLTGVIDATFESRGQVDLTFTVVARESAAIQTALSASLTTTVRSAGGSSQTIVSQAEVTS